MEKLKQYLQNADQFDFTQLKSGSLKKTHFSQSQSTKSQLIRRTMTISALKAMECNIPKSPMKVGCFTPGLSLSQKTPIKLKVNTEHNIQKPFETSTKNCTPSTTKQVNTSGNVSAKYKHSNTQSPKKSKCNITKSFTFNSPQQRRSLAGKYKHSQISCEEDENQKYPICQKIQRHLKPFPCNDQLANDKIEQIDNKGIVNASYHLPSLVQINQSDKSFKYQRNKNSQFKQQDLQKKEQLENKNPKIAQHKKVLSSLLNVSYDYNECEDEKDQDLVGLQAICNYQRNYKHLDKILQQNSKFNIQNSFFTEMSNYYMKQNLMPRKLGFIKQQGNEDEIKLQQYKVGHYLNAIPTFLNAMLNIDQVQLDISSNNIDSRMAKGFFSEVTQTPKTLNMAFNRLGKQGCDNICRVLQVDQRQSLQDLNLEGNKLTDYCTAGLLQSLTEHDSLKKLNLSHNFLAAQSAIQIKKMLIQTEILKELYLHNNQFRCDGGVLIFEGAVRNTSLKLIDMSVNYLGSYIETPFLTQISKKNDSKVIKNNKKQQQEYFENDIKSQTKEQLNDCVKAICELINCTNKKLYHMDISLNQFTLKECQKISKVLSTNQSIYGLHICEGNFGHVDKQGYLVFDQNLNSQAQNKPPPLSSFMPYRRIEGFNKRTHNYYPNDQTPLMNVVDTCWICEGWQEEIFIYQHPVKQSKKKVLEEQEIDFLDSFSEVQEATQSDEQSEFPTHVYLHLCFLPVEKVKDKFVKIIRDSKKQKETYQFETFQMKHTINGKYTHTQLCSPSPMYFFFSYEVTDPINIDVKQIIFTINKQYKQIIFRPSLCEVKISQLKADEKINAANTNAFKFTSSFNDGLILHGLTPFTHFNVLDLSNEVKPLIHSDYYFLLIQTVPRSDELLLKVDKKRKPSWTIERSIFRKFTDTENNDIQQKCLKQDMDKSKISNILKDEEEFHKVEVVLTNYYSQMLKVYRYLSSLSSDGNVLKINQRVFRNYIANTQLLKEKGLGFHLSDFDLLSYTTTAVNNLPAQNNSLQNYVQNQNQQNLMQKSAFIYRHHFIEILVRMAMDRSFKNGPNKNLSSEELMEKFLTEFILPPMQDFDSNMWRFQRLFNKHTEQVISKYRAVLLLLFNKYACSTVTKQVLLKDTQLKQSLSPQAQMKLQPGLRMFMTDFRQIFADAALFDDFFLERDAYLAYNLSCNLPVPIENAPNISSQNSVFNENDCLRLTFFEFIEALARCAEKISLFPVGVTEQDDEQAVYSFQKRLTLPLCIKLESLLVHFMRKELDRQLKAVLCLPTMTMFPDMLVSQIQNVLQSPTSIKKRRYQRKRMNQLDLQEHQIIQSQSRSRQNPDQEVNLLSRMELEGEGQVQESSAQNGGNNETTVVKITEESNNNGNSRRESDDQLVQKQKLDQLESLQNKAKPINKRMKKTALTIINERINRKGLLRQDKSTEDELIDKKVSSPKKAKTFIGKPQSEQKGTANLQLILSKLMRLDEGQAVDFKTSTKNDKLNRL